jgi:hypothetical protein
MASTSPHPATQIAVAALCAFFTGVGLEVLFIMPEGGFSEGVQNRFIPTSYLQLVKQYF